MKQLAPGILKLDNQLFYFGASAVRQALLADGFDEDEAAAFVGRLVMQALDAEAGQRPTVHKVNA